MHHKHAIKIRFGGLFCVLIFSMFLSGCLFTFKSNPQIMEEAFVENPPRRVAILPFENKTDNEDLDEQARSAIYNSMVSKNYEDIEIGLIDDILANAALETGKNPMNMSPEELSSRLDVDGIFYGIVEDFSKSYWVFYSHLKITLTVRLYDVRKKNYIFTDTVTAYNRNIAPAGSIVGIVTSTVKTLWHLRKSEKIDTMERLARRLVEEIPNPALEKNASAGYIKKVQVDIPGIVLRKEDRIDVTITGKPGLKASFDIGNYRTGIKMKETSPGVYQGAYKIKSGDNLEYGLVKGQLSSEAGRDVMINYNKFFSIDTEAPTTPSILTIVSTRDDFRLHLSLPEDEDFDHYLIYRTTKPEKGYTEFEESVNPSIILDDLESGKTYFFRAASVDALGNRSNVGNAFEFTVPPEGPVRIEHDFTGYSTLYAYSSPYRINEIIRLPKDSVLFIEAGVEIQFGEKGGFLIEGELSALGTDDDPILIEGEEGWRGIRLLHTGDLQRSRLAFMTIRNASTGLHLRNGRLEARKLSVTDCRTGISAGKKTFLRIVDSEFRSNHTAIKSDADDTILKNITLIKNEYMTEFGGVPEKQQEKKITDFSRFRY